VLDFGCRTASAKWVQDADYTQLSEAEAALFAGENAFFRCRQRNRDARLHACERPTLDPGNVQLQAVVAKLETKARRQTGGQSLSAGG
jgi:hypothetical protein